MNSARSNRRGFTLVELLAVIAVIGVLMAIIMPALGRARATSKRTACASNLRQLGIGLRSYLSASNDLLPYASLMPSIGPAPLAGPTPLYIADVLSAHVCGSADVFRCPNDVDGSARPSPNAGITYFDSERSSYEYRVRYGGLTMAQVLQLIARRAGPHFAENTVWLLRDFDNFHAAAGTTGSRRYLYSDGHVTDFENF